MEEHRAERLRGVVEDPDALFGIVVGAAFVLLVFSYLFLRGRVCWVPTSTSSRERRTSSLARSMSSDGETWYDALEDHLPVTAGMVDYASRAVPLLLGEDAGADGNHASPSSMPRLTKLLGTSVPKQEPPSGVCPGEKMPCSWSVGDASECKVRAGPNYPKKGLKDPSLPALYECVGVDIVSAGCRLDEAIPRLGPLPAGGSSWHKGCRVPRCITVNCQLPFVEGPKLWGEHPPEDAGVSVVLQFVATPELLSMAEATASGEAVGSDGRIPAVRLLQAVFERGTLELPNKARPGFYSSGAMKALAWVEDLENVELPRLLRPTVEKFNGKPVLLSNYGRMFVDPGGEWMEIDFDVRLMSWPTKSVLCKLRERLRSVSAHAAFVIQGTQDDELPEVVLGNLRLHGMDLEHGAWIDDDRAPAGARFAGASP